MKNTSKITFLTTFKYVLILCIMGLVSCSDEDDNNDSDLTDEEISTVIESSLVDNGGLIEDINFMSISLGNTLGRPANQFEVSSFSEISCNQTLTQNFTNSNSNGNQSWTIESNWLWSLNCDAQQNSISLDINGNGSLDFDGPNLSKDVTRTHDFNITGLEPASDFWTYNANHNRTGIIQSNVGNQNSMNTVLNFGSTDLLISKTTQQIASGTFEIDFNATLFNGNIISRGATVVFNGNQNATVTLDNGNVFEISW